MRSDNTPLLWEGEEHPPLDLLRDYQEEALPAPASHQVERHLLDCELCTDLLQGMTLSDRSTTRRAVGDLNAQLRHLGNRKRKKRLPLIPILEWRAAATFLVLLCSIGLVVYFLYEQLQRERIQKAQQAELAAQAELYAIRSSTDTLLIAYPGYEISAAPATTPAPPAVLQQQAVASARGRSSRMETTKSDERSRGSTPAAGMVAGAAIKNSANSQRLDLEERSSAKVPSDAAEESEKLPPTAVAANAPKVASEDAAQGISRQPAQVKKPAQVDSLLEQSFGNVLQGKLAGVAVQDKTKRSSPDTARGRSDMFAKTMTPPVVRSANESIVTDMAVAGKQVRGQVLSEEGEPLPGVNVVVKGTNKGTSTDLQGNFILTAPAENATLAFNYVGYKAEEVKVDPGTPSVKVELSPDRRSLEEVVVVGYGTKRATAVPTTKPEPVGGMKAFENYLKQHRRYPASLTPDKVSGRVVVEFMVTAQGDLQNIHLRKSLHPAIDAEALRLVKEGPAWKPATSNGKPVAHEVRVSIRFRPE